MSDILNTGLDSEALGCCIKLCEDNVDATALAQVLKDWRTRRADQDDLNLNKEQSLVILERSESKFSMNEKYCSPKLAFAVCNLIF